jgi:predicted ATPase
MLQLALVDGLQGRDRAARALSERGRVLAVATAHTSTVLYAHTWGGTLYAMLEDPAATLASARIMSRMGQEHDLPFWQVLGRFFEDWAAWLAGDGTVAMDGMRRSVEFVQDHGLKWYSILLPVLMAAPEAAIGDGKDAGLALVDQALAEIAATGLMWLRPEALRHRAAILAQGCEADRDAAEQTYLKALHTAHLQSFHRSALRAIVGLANLRGALPQGDIVEDVLRSCPADADMAELAIVKRGLWSEMWDSNPRLPD